MSLAASCDGCVEAPARCSTSESCPDGAVCSDGACILPLPVDESLPWMPSPSGSPSEPADAGPTEPLPVEPDPSTSDPSTSDPSTSEPVDAGTTPPAPPPTAPDPSTPDAGPDEPPTPAPDACRPTAERCSLDDEDCDGVNNDGLDCTFLAASNDTIWRVDPFAGTATAVLSVQRRGTEVIFDIDTAPDGSLVATAGRSLYAIGDDGALTTLVSGRLPFNPNALAVGADGAIFVANHDAFVGSKIVSAPNVTSTPSFFTSLGDLNSSGDCVRHKTRLLVSVADAGNDRLAAVDLQSGNVSIVGDLSFDGVMGLSSAFGLLFGVTGDGEVLLIDDNDATTVLLATVDVRFTGAASRY